MVALLAVVGFLSTGCFGTWGLRSSYRSYVTSPASDGQISTVEGATWLDGAGSGKGPFQYRVDSSAYNPGTRKGFVQLIGGVKTSAHPTADGSVLDLSLWNPRLEIDGNVGTLYVDLNFRPYEGFAPPALPALQAKLDVPFATVDLSGQNLTPDSNTAINITNAPTTGIPAAMELIGWDDFYGSPVTLDPFSVSFWVSSQFPTPATPRIVVSQTTGLHVGDTVTVWGSGFDPTANLGTRAPLSGQPAGAYAVFGKFANIWQPSTGAPTSSRTVLAQKWALGQSSRSLLDPTGTSAAYATIDARGYFETTLQITASSAAGNYGIYTYPGSGAVNAAYELAVPLTLAP
jgi:hypothetical protein